VNRASLSAAALLLAGCPTSAAFEERTLTADCCELEDAGTDTGDAALTADAGAGCRWVPIRYHVPRVTEQWASDARACRGAGLEPYARDRP
jgi:hypothetical protein